MWWGALHFAQPLQNTPPPKKKASSLPTIAVDASQSPSPERKSSASVLAELLSPMRIEDSPERVEEKDKFLQGQMRETLGRFRTLSKGFRSDYLGTFAKDDHHLNELMVNHNAVARKHEQQLRKTRSLPPSYDALRTGVRGIMSQFEGDQDAKTKQYMKERKRRIALEEYIPTLDFVSSDVDPTVFCDFIVFIMKMFCTVRGRYVGEAWREVFDVLSFTKSRDVLCVNEFLTNLQLMSFPHEREDITRLFADIAEDGVLTRKRFESLQEVAKIMSDGMKYGMEEAKKMHGMRMMMAAMGGSMPEPERPKSLMELTQGTVLMSVWKEGRQQIRDQKRLFDGTNPAKEAARKAMTSSWDSDSEDGAVYDSKQNLRSVDVEVQGANGPRKSVVTFM